MKSVFVPLEILPGCSSAVCRIIPEGFIQFRYKSLTGFTDGMADALKMTDPDVSLLRT